MIYKTKSGRIYRCINSVVMETNGFYGLVDKRLQTTVLCIDRPTFDQFIDEHNGIKGRIEELKIVKLED